MRSNQRYCSLVVVLAAAMGGVYADSGSEGHSGQAVEHAGRGSSQAAQSIGQAAGSGARVVSGVTSVPLAASGAAGASAAAVGGASANAAVGVGPGKALVVTDEVLTAGPSPDRMLGGQGKGKEQGRDDAK